MKKKLYAYLIKFNKDNPSYDLRFYEKLQDELTEGKFQLIRASELDTYIEMHNCPCCKGLGKS